MTGRHGQERHPEQRVGPGGERGKGQAGVGHVEVHLHPFGPPDPVGLQALRQRRPVERIQAVQQVLRVGRDPQEPLLHHPFGDPGPAPLAPVALDLLERQHRLAGRAPHHRGLLAHGQACPVQLQEDPLGPSVEGGVAGHHLVPPCPRRSQPPQLPPVVRDGLLGQRPRVLADPQREVLGVDAEGVESHRLEQRPAPHPLVAAVDVGPAVRVGVPDVQALGGGVGELDQVVELLLRPHPADVDLVEAVGLPPGLPARLDLPEVMALTHRLLLPHFESGETKTPRPIRREGVSASTEGCPPSR